MRRHPFHAICPYFAMFPESFAANAMLCFSKPGDLVLDPFVGRGTSIFQAALLDRRGIGIDINPVAACVSGAKVAPPDLTELLARIKRLAREFPSADSNPGSELPEFFKHCFHPETLAQLMFLRHRLDWSNNGVDRFVMALILGLLHGESSRSSRYFSNQMPRTISTKPDYSVRWWKSRDLHPPLRDVFVILDENAKWRFSCGVAPRLSEVRQGDARNAQHLYRELDGKVTLVVTSPPYLDVTDYAEDQWLRLWMLGGAPYPSRRTYRDDRHRDVSSYWSFLGEVWTGCRPILNDHCTVVVRIGGRLCADELQTGLVDSLEAAGLRIEVSRLISSSQVLAREAGKFRKRGARNVEHDFAFEVRSS